MISAAFTKLFWQLDADTRGPLDGQRQAYIESGLRYNAQLQKLLDPTRSSATDKMWLGVARHIHALAPNALKHAADALTETIQRRPVRPLTLRMLRIDLAALQETWNSLRKNLSRTRSPGNIAAVLGFGVVCVQLRMTLYRAHIASSPSPSQ